MKLGKHTIALVLMLALMPATGAWAQASNLKIGVVNLARLLDGSPQASGAMEQLQEEFAPRQREIVAQQSVLAEKSERFQRDGEVMGPEERRNMERELRNEERDLQRAQQEYVEDLNLRRNEELGKLQRELLQQVQQFGQSQGYDLIIGDGVLFAGPALDVTDELLSALGQGGN